MSGTEPFEGIDEEEIYEHDGPISHRLRSPRRQSYDEADNSKNSEDTAFRSPVNNKYDRISAQAKSPVASPSWSRVSSSHIGISGSQCAGRSPPAADLFSSSPSDRNQLWRSCSDGSQTESSSPPPRSKGNSPVLYRFPSRALSSSPSSGSQDFIRNAPSEKLVDSPSNNHTTPRSKAASTTTYIRNFSPSTAESTSRGAEDRALGTSPSSGRSFSRLSQSPSQSSYELSRSTLARRLSLERRNTLLSQSAYHEGMPPTVSPKHSAFDPTLTSPNGSTTSIPALAASPSRSRMLVPSMLTERGSPPAPQPPVDVDEPWIDLPSNPPPATQAIKTSPEHMRSLSDSQAFLFKPVNSSTDSDTSSSSSFPPRPALSLVTGRARSYTGGEAALIPIQRPHSGKFSGSTEVKTIHPSRLSASADEIRQAILPPRPVNPNPTRSPSPQLDDLPSSSTPTCANSGLSISRTRSPAPSDAIEDRLFNRWRSSSPSSSPVGRQGSSSPKSFKSHHRRSPSLGGHPEAMLSISPRTPTPGSPNNGLLLSPSTSSASPTSPSNFLSPSPPGAHSPVSPVASSTSSSNTASRDIYTTSSPSSGRPVGLALDAFTSFRFGSRTPSPPNPEAVHFTPPAALSTSDSDTLPDRYQPLTSFIGDDGNRDQDRWADGTEGSNKGVSYHDAGDEIEQLLSPFGQTTFSSFVPGSSPEAALNAQMHLSPLERQPSQLMAVDGLYENAEDAPPSPLMATIPLPLADDATGWGSSFAHDKDSSHISHTTDVHEHEIDEAGLTALERIFLFAKSEVTEYRETVCRSLPKWLEEVDICDAVDYVLPLLAGLTNDEESVKEALVTVLDEIMFWFFNNCPITELSASHQIVKANTDGLVEADLEARLREAEEQGIPTRMVVSESGLEVVEIEQQKLSSTDTDAQEARRILALDIGIDSITPGTGSTLVGTDGTVGEDDAHMGDAKDMNTEGVSRPGIHASSFHETLCRLLLDDSSIISSLAQEALVRLLLRLEGGYGLSEDCEPLAASSESIGPKSISAKSPRPYAPYTISNEAKEIVVRELVSGLVVSLAHLDDDDPPEILLLLKGGPVSHAGTPATESESTASKFSSFFEDQLHGRGPQAADGPEFTAVDGQQGRLVALCLITALADTERCLPPRIYANELYPAVLTCVEDLHPGVRKQSAEAIAALAQYVDASTAIDSLLPTVQDLSRDLNVLVRSSVCSSLPEYAKAVRDPTRQRQLAVELADHFAVDLSTQVQQALWDIIGPLIFIFEGKVPDELVDIFVGKTIEDAQSSQVGPSKAHFAPLVPPAFAKTASSNTGLANTSAKSKGTWDPSSDHERALATAYNLPGVCLSLGAGGWPRIRLLHNQLATISNVPQVRYLIASSLHDIARIIGTEQAGSDLVPLFHELRLHEDHDVVTRLWERTAEFIQALPLECLPEIVYTLRDTWYSNPRSNWRLREILAESLAPVAEHLDNEELREPYFDLLDQALLDEIAAVRQQAIDSLPPLFSSMSTYNELWDPLQTIVYELRDSGNHKSRALFSRIVLKHLDVIDPTTQDIDDIVHLWVNDVAQLAEDKVVDVRLAAARAVVRMASLKTEAGEVLQTISDILSKLETDSEAVVREIVENVGHRLQEGANVEQFDGRSSTPSDSDTDESFTRGLRTPMENAASRNSPNSLSLGSSAPEDNCNQFPPVSKSDSNTGDEEDEVDSIDLESFAIYDADIDEYALASSSLASSSLLIGSLSDTPSQTCSTTLISGPKESTDTFYTSLDNIMTPENNSTPTSKSKASSTPLLIRSRSDPDNVKASPSPPIATGANVVADRPWRFSMREEEQYVAIDVLGGG